MAAQRAGAHPVRPSTNGGPASDAQPDDMANTRELRLMATYSQLRRHCGNETPAPPPPLPPPADQAVEKKRKSFKRRLGRIFSCISAPKGDDASEGGRDRTGGGEEEEEEEEEKKEREAQAKALATTLMELADESFVPPEIEEDSPDDELAKMAGQLLRLTGDSVNEQYDCDQVFTELVQNYSMFSRLMAVIFRMLNIRTSQPVDQGDQKDTKKNIAVTCEVASRLAAMDTHPMSRVLGLGARYLKENYPVGDALNATTEDSDSEDEVD